MSRDTEIRYGQSLLRESEREAEVEMVRRELADALQLADRYRAALVEISEHGRVCEAFETCSHVACADSSGACLAALEALKEEVSA
jgi:hypothetical protein